MQRYCWTHVRCLHSRLSCQSGTVLLPSPERLPDLFDWLPIQALRYHCQERPCPSWSWDLPQLVRATNWLVNLMPGLRSWSHHLRASLGSLWQVQQTCCVLKVHCKVLPFSYHRCRHYYSHEVRQRWLHEQSGRSIACHQRDGSGSNEKCPQKGLDQAWFHQLWLGHYGQDKECW